MSLVGLDDGFVGVGPALVDEFIGQFLQEAVCIFRVGFEAFGLSAGGAAEGVELRSAVIPVEDTLDLEGLFRGGGGHGPLDTDGVVAFESFVVESGGGFEVGDEFFGFGDRVIFFVDLVVQEFFEPFVGAWFGLFEQVAKSFEIGVEYDACGVHLFRL